ncbi:MAG: rRNA maturation RNase YbeY [Pseudomonadota bacterium]|nr:rRNA maturation RNase YbeY [Pseudomonadota bacterium]
MRQTMLDAQPQVAIRIDCEGWRNFSSSICETINDVVRATLDYTEKGPHVEVSILLTDDISVSRLNKTWRGVTGPTNVLSFPSDSEHSTCPKIIGDVVLELQTIQAEAILAEISDLDHFKHLLVHGVLHLLGHDHENLREAQIMESLEVCILTTLGVSDPYNIADR